MNWVAPEATAAAAGGKEELWRASGMPSRFWSLPTYMNLLLPVPPVSTLTTAIGTGVGAGASMEEAAVEALALVIPLATRRVSAEGVGETLLVGTKLPGALAGTEGCMPGVRSSPPTELP